MLRLNPLSAIRVPDMDQIKLFTEIVQRRHYVLDDIWCTMDGLKLYLQCSGNLRTQNNYYNGWTHDHYVTSVFVFCPDGTICMCCYNCPGSIHDSKIAELGNIYKKLERVYQTTGARCAANSAFAAKRYPFLEKSAKTFNIDVNNVDEIDEVRIAMEINKQATSMSQSAEWSMRALKASFSRLHDRLRYEVKEERKIILKMFILLYNLCARTVGINQIKNVYLENLEGDTLTRLGIVDFK
jgi:DDE superfamily endonuclease